MTDTITETVVDKEVEKLLTYYAFADDKKKTWFISKANRKPYKELVLLYVLGCKKSIKVISKDGIAPKVGDIVNSINSERLEIVTLDWA